MLVLLSPAKRLNESNEQKLDESGIPCFQSEAFKVNRSLKKYSAKKLMELQGISADLAGLNRARNLAWNTNPSEAVFYQALYLFNGDAYLGLDASTLSEVATDFARDHLRILSGLYGLLKPTDLIEPYRLEMGTKLKVGRNENLYKFWQKKITAKIKEDFGDDLIVNLASKEYASAVDFKKLKNRIVDVEFKDRNAQGQYKVISFFAKKARGLMTRFILENQLETAEELIKFESEDYRYAANDSSPNKLVFLRDH